MSNMSKELLKVYSKELNFSTTNAILNALKEIFRDVLQESLEAEMNESLCYGKKKVVLILGMGILRRSSKQNYVQLK